jgi:hypothetical protein
MIPPFVFNRKRIFTINNVPSHASDIDKTDQLGVAQDYLNKSGKLTETLARLFLEAPFNHPFDLRHYYLTCQSLRYLLRDVV